MLRYVRGNSLAMKVSALKKLGTLEPQTEILVLANQTFHPSEVDDIEFLCFLGQTLKTEGLPVLPRHIKEPMALFINCKSLFLCPSPKFPFPHSFV